MVNGNTVINITTSMKSLSIFTLCMVALHATAILPCSGIEAEQYAQFTATLEKMQEQQSSDYYDAATIVYDTTQDETAISEWMEKAAKENYPAALLYMANTSISGILINQDKPEDIKQYLQQIKKASDAGYIPATLYYSTCINAGIDGTPNKNEALRLLIPPASAGNKEARFKWLQLSGRLQNVQDLERPEVIAEIEKENDCVLMYASMITSDQDIQIQNLQDAAALGNGDAFYQLGISVSEVNPKASYDLMQKAAHLHHPNAIAIVGGIESSPIKAGSILSKTGAAFKPQEGIRLQKLAAMMGSNIAQSMLGEQYLKGSEYIEQNEQRAFYHIKQAASANEANALLIYSYMLMKGIACQADTKLALNICGELIARRIKAAMLLYAYAHYKGLGVENNAKEAANILQEAAGMEQPEAYVYLAFITNKGGTNLKADSQQAELYLRMAKLDLGDKADLLYEQLVEAGDWEFMP